MMPRYRCGERTRISQRHKDHVDIVAGLARVGPMRMFCLVALLGACSFRHGALGNAPDDATPNDTTRPIDAKPDATDAQSATSDAAGDATSTPVDTDNDTVPDNVDNCPLIANVDQRDHDGDGKGDVCDLCPHLANASDPDTDSDGVGDACDPHPSTAGDQRVLFEGFYDATSISTWTQGGGTWAVANGALSQSSTNGGTSITIPGAVTRANITVGVTLGAASMTMFSTPSLSVVGGYVANNQSYTCSVGAVPTQGNRVSALAFWRDSNNQPQFGAAGANWTGTYAQGSVIRLTGAITGGNISCTAIQSATTVSAQTNTGPTTSGTVQLTTNQLAVDFDYVFVVNAGS